MEKAIKVSVIVPIYNAESFIERTLNTLCKSTLKEIEILAINDGSNDNTLEVLKRCAVNESRIRVIDKPNGGIYDARNRGLEEASGEFICFCDHDDIIEPQMYEVMYDKAINNDCELVMCSTGKLSGGVKYHDWDLPDCVFEKDEVIKECFLPSVFNKSCLYSSEKQICISDYIWKCMIKRSFIVEHNLGLRSFVNHDDDRIFLLDVLARANKVALIADVLYYWRVNSKSQSHKPKYVVDMYNKDIAYQNAIQEIMKTAGCDENLINKFLDFNSAFRYSRLVWNEINHLGSKRSERIAILKKMYEEENFDNKIKESRYFIKNMFARKIVCNLLQKKQTFLAYEFCEVYVGIRQKLQEKSFWIKIESMVKR